MRRGVVPGLEILARRRPRWLRDRRVGLLMHQASVTRRFEPARDVLHRLCGNRLTALFGPQHGIAGEQQDNMRADRRDEGSMRGLFPRRLTERLTERPTPRGCSWTSSAIVRSPPFRATWSPVIARNRFSNNGLAGMTLVSPCVVDPPFCTPP